MATDAKVTVAARLDRLPPSPHTRRLVTLLSLGGWFEFYDLFFTAYIAIGLFKGGIFKPTTQGLFDLEGFASFVAALPDWRTSELFDDKQRALLAYTEALDTHGGDVDDATYAAFAKQFTPREIVELTITVVTYYGTGQLTKALRVKPESDGRQAVKGNCQS